MTSPGFMDRARWSKLSVKSLKRTLAQIGEVRLLVLDRTNSGILAGEASEGRTPWGH
jgi:hypothetical protein